MAKKMGSIYEDVSKDVSGALMRLVWAANIHTTSVLSFVLHIYIYTNVVLVS